MYQEIINLTLRNKIFYFNRRVPFQIPSNPAFKTRSRAQIPEPQYSWPKKGMIRAQNSNNVERRAFYLGNVGVIIRDGTVSQYQQPSILHSMASAFSLKIVSSTSPVIRYSCISGLLNENKASLLNGIK